MKIHIGGLARGVSSGLRDYALIESIKRGKKRDEQEDTEFGWKKQDRDKQTKKQGEIDSDTQVIQDYLFPPETASNVASGGISPVAQPPLADAVNPAPVSPIDAASVVPGVTQPPGARAPMANAVNVPAAGLKEPPPSLSRDTDIGKESSALNRAFFRLAKNGAPMDPAAITRFRQLPMILQQEGVVQAIKVANTGDYEGAAKVLNSTGKYRGFSLVEGKPGTYDDMGQKMPTHILTLKDASGKTMTINTAEINAGMRDYPEVLKAMQENRKIGADEKRAEASMITAQASKTSAEKKTKDEKGGLTQKDGLNVLRERFGGKLDSMGQWSMDEKNKDVAMRSYVIYQENLKTMEELPAAQKAADQAEREKATGKLPRTATGTDGAAPSNEGTKNFRTLWSN